MAAGGGFDKGKQRHGGIGVPAIAIDRRLDGIRCDGWPGNSNVELIAYHLLAVLFEYVVNRCLVGIVVTNRADQPMGIDRKDVVGHAYVGADRKSTRLNSSH